MAGISLCDGSTNEDGSIVMLAGPFVNASIGAFVGPLKRAGDPVADVGPMVSLSLVGDDVTVGELVMSGGRLFDGTEGIGEEDGVLSEGADTDGKLSILGADMTIDGSNVFSDPEGDRAVGPDSCGLCEV